MCSDTVKVKSTTVTATAGQSRPTTWTMTGSTHTGTGHSSTSEPNLIKGQCNNVELKLPKQNFKGVSIL